MPTSRPFVAKVPATPAASTRVSPGIQARGGDVADPLPGPRGCSNFKLRQADRLVSRHYDAVIGNRSGLKTSQYSLLSHIAAHGPLRPADLAQLMALEPSTLTRNLQPLVAQGWVLVGPGADGRSRQVSLTDAGRAKRTEAQRAWKQAQLAFNDKLGVERVARLHALLDECMHLLADDGGPGGDTGGSHG